jgi:hypothetical protein
LLQLGDVFGDRIRQADGALRWAACASSVVSNTLRIDARLNSESDVTGRAFATSASP